MPVRPKRKRPDRRVAVIHTDDPAEAFDFCRGVAAYSPRGGPWRLRSIPFAARTARSLPRPIDPDQIDGVIMMPGWASVLLPLHRRGVNVVDVDDTRAGAPDLPFPQVRLDHRHVGRLAAEHLLERGFDRLLYVGVQSPWSQERARGFADAARAAGIAHLQAVAPTYPAACKARWLFEHVRAFAHPLGVMACNDDVGARLIDVAEQHGWDVPRRLGVIGVDDRITECIRVVPPLSSISNERFRAGQEAARLLDERFTRPSAAPGIHWLRPQRVIERESTSVYVYGDPELAAALQYIRLNACSGATVDQLVRHVHLSRSTLVRRFEQRLGRSPGDELRRARLDAVKRLLEQTRRPLEDIAAATGFASMSSLSHCFRAAVGVSPDQYRFARPPAH